MKKLRIAVIDSDPHRLVTQEHCNKRIEGLLSQIVTESEIYRFEINSRNRLIFDIDLAVLLEEIAFKDSFDVIHLGCGIIFFDGVTELMDALKSVSSRGTVVCSSYRYGRNFCFPDGMEKLICGLNFRNEADNCPKQSERRKGFKDKSSVCKEECRYIASLADIYQKINI